jgi:predicted TIM-barrel fold metal-dependent hydrolase
MRPARSSAVCLAGLALTTLVGIAAAATDHHLHLVSPELAKVMGSLADQDPATAKLLDPEVTRVRGTAEALAVLDAAGLQKGVLLSGGYMYSSPMLAAQQLDAVALLHSENAYNVAAAAASGGRLLAFIGLNPLVPESRAELDYWVKHGGVTGVKLHFGNSGIDFHDAGQVRQVRELFAAVSAARLALVVHPRSRPQYGADEAKIFVEQILPAAGETPVQLAHGGGWGGLDDGTLDALEVYTGAMARGAPGTQQMVIDLAMLTLGEETALPLRERAVALIRRAGLKRFVMGSDWPAVYTPAAHEAYLLRQLPFTTEEWQTLRGNDAPYVR